MCICYMICDFVDMFVGARCMILYAHVIYDGANMFVDAGCMWMICLYNMHILDFFVMRSEEDIPEAAPFGTKLIICNEKIPTQNVSSSCCKYRLSGTGDELIWNNSTFYI